MKKNEKSRSEVSIRYYPTPYQKRFHKDRNKYRYRGVFGGTGSGKTFAGVYEALLWAMENPGSVGIIFEPTIKMVKRVLIDQTLQDKRFLGAPFETQPLVHEFNKTELRLELETPDPNKISTIYFLSLEYPEAAEGSSIDYAYIDEARLILKFQEAWESVLRRLRGSGRNTKNNAEAWVTTTPDYPGSFMYKFFVDPRTKDPQTRSYHWSSLENSHLDEDYKNAILRSFTGSLRERFVHGGFALAGNLTFDFDANLHVLDKLPDKDRFVEMVYGVDWGWTTPACILAVGLDGDGRAYVVEEFYQSRAKPETLIETARSMEQSWGRGPFYCDRSEPRTIDQFVEAGLDAVADKSRREEGIRELGGRFPDAGDGKPRVFIHVSCGNLINELLTYNEDRKENDHAVDALRYALVNHEDLSGEIDISFGPSPLRDRRYDSGYGYRPLRDW